MILPKFNWPPIEHFPTQYWNDEITFLTNFQTNCKPQFLQFFSQFSRYFVPTFIFMRYFQFETLLETFLQAWNSTNFNFITSHLLVNSNIWAIKPIKLIPLVRSQTRKTIKFHTLEQKLIKFKLSFSSLTSVFHHSSHSFTAPNFFQTFYKFHHSHNTKFTKKITSLCQPRETKFSKILQGFDKGT